MAADRVIRWSTALAVLGVAAVAAVASYEHAYDLVRAHHESGWAPVEDTSEIGHDADPLQEQAAELFAEQLAADRIPLVRAIRAQLHVGQPRAQRLRDFLATRIGRHDVNLAA